MVQILCEGKKHPSQGLRDPCGHSAHLILPMRGSFGAASEIQGHGVFCPAIIAVAGDTSFGNKSSHSLCAIRFAVAFFHHIIVSAAKPRPVADTPCALLR